MLGVWVGSYDTYFLSLEVIKLFPRIKYLYDVGRNAVIRWEAFSLQICGLSEKSGFYLCLSKTLISSKITYLTHK